MTETQPCGDRLTGLYHGVTLVCELEHGHRGAHEAVAPSAFSATLHWTSNAYWLQAASA